MSGWADVREAWASGWQSLQAAALSRYEAAIQADPTAFAARVQAFHHELATARSTLDHLRGLLPYVPAGDEALSTYRALEQRYHDLAAGLYAETHPADDAVGIAPLVVAGLVIGAAGIAWAIAAYEYAVNLRELTALADRDLAARVEASREGRSLQPSTVTPPAEPPEPSRGVAWALLGGLALVAGVLTLPAFLPKRASTT